LADDPDRFFTIPDSPKKRTLEYGWEPDGSGMIWHNKEKENQRITVESIRFEYAVAKPRYDETEITRVLPMPANAMAEQRDAQATLVQNRLGEILTYLRWVAVATAVLAFVIVIVVVRQGWP
jgi:hypothetical protein